MGQKVLHWSRLVSRFTLSRTPANQSIHPVTLGRRHVHPSLAFEWVNYTLVRCPWQYTKKVLIHSGQVLSLRCCRSAGFVL